MMSDDWHIDVAEIEESIDHIPVRMLAYEVSTVEKKNETKLILNNISEYDYELFRTILDSFFCPDNPIMGKMLWNDKEGAVFLRSKNPINTALPVTSDYGRKGAVFCGYQMLGTNPFDLVVCLHKYRKEDRERRSLYAFNVIDIFEEIVQYVNPQCAMIMLEKMRRYWNTYPRKNIDIHSWSATVNALIRKVAYSPEAKNIFFNKYKNILCLRKVESISEKNRRWQARAWLTQQEKKYILAKDTFKVLGYPTIEEECDRHGGFVVDDEADELGAERGAGVLVHGGWSPESVASAAQMGRLYRHVRKTIASMASELRDGAIDADPYFRSRTDRACENCDFFDACRFAEGEAGEHSRCLKKLGADEVWALMDGEEESDA